MNLKRYFLILIAVGIIAYMGGESIIAGVTINKTLKTNSALERGLVGHWTFDGKDMIDNVNDVSGNGNDGVIVGQVSTTTAVGKIGQALDFDGSDDYVEMEDSPSLDILGNFTLSAWIYESVPQGFANIVMKGHSSGAGEAYGMAINSSKIWTKMGTSGEVDQSTDSVPTNQWAHITEVWDGTNLYFYIDGVADSGNPHAHALGPFNSVETLRIGDWNQGSFPFNGQIDDVRIYNRALSAQEISRLYDLGGTTRINITLPSIQDGLVGHWTFDGKDMISNVADISGQGNHGSLVGQTSTTSVAGKIGQGLSFDGVDDRVEISNTIIPADGSPFTISTWVKRVKGTPGSRSHYIFTMGVFPNNILHTIDGGIADEILRFTWQSNGANISTGFIFTPNIWHHIVGVTTGSTADLYIDGVVVASASSGTSTEIEPVVTIGRSTSSFEGLIDDVRIYNRALSAEEVKRLYQAGSTTRINMTLPSVQDGLVGHWSFDGGDMIDNVTDISGQGNHGSLVGQTSTTSVAGKIGQGLRFDGSDDYVDVDSVLPLAYPVSISLWIKTSDTTAVFRDPFAGGNAGLHNNFLALQLNTTQKLILNAKHDGSNGTITSALNYNDGIWHHVVGLWRSTIDRELYADGISIGTSAVDIGGFPTLDTAYIGAININGSIIQHFPGIIDDVRIYNRALTPNEIGRLYDVGH